MRTDPTPLCYSFTAWIRLVDSKYATHYCRYFSIVFSKLPVRPTEMFYQPNIIAAPQEHK